MTEENEAKNEKILETNKEIDIISNEEPSSKRESVQSENVKEKKKLWAIIALIGLIIGSIIIFAFVFDFFPDLTTGEFDCIYHGTGNNISILNPNYKIDELKIIINDTEYENENPIVNILGDFHVKIKVLTDELKMKNMFKGTNVKSVVMTSEKSTLVKNMESCFESCKYLEEFSIEDFDTSEVTNMNNLFFNCINLEKVEMSDIDTDDLERVDSTFAYTNISEIKLTNFKMKILLNSKNTFDSCNTTIIMKKKEENEKHITQLENKYNIRFEFV